MGGHFSFASVLLPSRFRFASVMRVNCEGQSASPVRDSWTPSVLLPFCFRYSSLSLFCHNSMPSEGAKLGITGALKRLHLRMLPGAPSPTPQNTSRPTSAVSATVCFRSASVLPEFLAPGRFGIFPAPRMLPGAPPARTHLWTPVRGPQSVFPWTPVRDSCLLPFCFRSASVPLPLCR